MSNETRVLDYYNEWAGKGVNPDNGTSVHQTTYGMYLQRAPNQWIVRWHDKDDPEGRRWDIMAFILGLNPTAATPKVDDQWKSYSQQMRKELTDTQRELADLKEAYNGLCEAHAEAAENLAETTDMSKLRENFEFAIEPFEYHRRPPILNAFDFAVELTKRDTKNEAVPE